MRVLIAVDKFKGSLTGVQVAAALVEGIRAAGPSIEVDVVPVADGGEGTLEAAFAAGYVGHPVTAAGPTGTPLAARIAVRGHVAIIEMASASGLHALPDGTPAPMTATSRGAGDLIRAALDLGCNQIVLGVGGSASTDGGAGMLSALGARLLDSDDRELRDGGAPLTRLARVDLTALDARLASTDIVLASDVENPLLGPRGAAAVFAPQKGATPDDIAALETALGRWVSVLEAQLGERIPDLAESPGAGAAGGVGFAALAILHARLEAGTEVVQRITGLLDRIPGADLIVTGEGSLDEQTLEGKAPMGVARAGRRTGVPVIAVCGQTTLSPAQLQTAGFARTLPLTELEPDVATCITNAAALLRRLGTLIAVESHRLTTQKEPHLG